MTPLCAHCHINCVKRQGNRVYTYCSRDCYKAAKRKVVLCANGCGNPRKNKWSQHCGEECRYENWLRRGGRRKLAIATQKAAEVRREQYTARLRGRLEKMGKKSEIWRAAYLQGYHTCYAMFLRQIRNGDIIVVRERRIQRKDAA